MLSIWWLVLSSAYAAQYLKSYFIHNFFKWISINPGTIKCTPLTYISQWFLKSKSGAWCFGLKSTIRLSKLFITGPIGNSEIWKLTIFTEIRVHLIVPFSSNFWWYQKRMGLSSFLSKLEITLKIWAKHAILMGYGCFTRSWNHHLRCVHLIVPSLVHLIVPTIHRKKILYWSNLVGQLTRNYKSTQAEVSFWTMGFNHNEKFGFLILLKHLIVPVGAFNSPMYKRD